MRGKILTLIALMATGFILTLIILNNTNIINLSPTNSEGSCNSLIYNEEGKTDIVFFGQKEEVETYTNYFLETSPYNRNKDEFNFYYINDYEPNCKMYKDIAIVCNSRDLVSYASKCPNDYIVVLKDEERRIRSSSQSNVLSINTAHPLSVLIHEFGHSFANLAEEYAPAKLKSNQQNCAESCDTFLDSNECFKGCSDSSHYRSIENGVMKTLKSNEYGAYNEMLIESQISEKTKSILTGFATIEKTDCKDQEYYLIELNIEESEIINKKLETGCVGKNKNIEFEYDKKDNTNLRVKLINHDKIYTDIEGEKDLSGEIFDEEITTIIKVPVLENIETIEIEGLSTISL
jgi:hypothetical protein